MEAKTHRLYTPLQRLDRARIHYTLARVRNDTVMICATVPGRRYEIDVSADGSIEVEVFGADGRMGAQEVVDDLIANYSDGPESTA